MAIFSAIGAAVSAAGSLLASTILSSTVGSFLIKAAVGVGLSLAAQSLAGEPVKPAFGIRGKIEAAGDVPRSFPIGLTATAGSLVYANTWGDSDSTKNKYLTQVIALSDLPVRSGAEGLVEFWCNGDKATIRWDEPDEDGRGFPVEEYKEDGRRLFVKFYDGTQTVADPFLVEKVGDDERPYQPTRVGRGVAYAIVTARVTPELFTGIPTFKFVLSGVRLYDPSRDSTNGGVGTQRLATPSTWGGDGDTLPAVQLYNLLRGFSYGGKWLYGLQNLPAARLPASHWVAQINKCRTEIGSGSSKRPTYRCGGELIVDRKVGDMVDGILTSCQGKLAETGGIYSLFCGAPEEPSFAIDDGVILSSEEQTFTPFFGLADSITGIAGKYPSPKEGWNVKPAPAIYRADLEQRAGQRRLMADVSFDMVPYPDQVQQLMKSAIQEAERERRHTLVLPSEFWAKSVPGAVFTWTSERNGYVSKWMRIDGVVDRANCDVLIDCTEVDPADYDWNNDVDYRVPVDGSVSTGRPPGQAMVGWDAEGIVYERQGKRRAAVELSWDGAQDDVRRVVWQIRDALTKERVTADGTDSVEEGRIVVTHNIFSDMELEARGRYLPFSQRRTSWSEWLKLKTPSVPNNDVDVVLANLNRDVTEMLQERFGFFDDAFARMDAYRLDEVTFHTADLVWRQHNEKRVGNAHARITAEEAIRVEENSAMAGRQLTVETGLKTANGKIDLSAKAIERIDTRVKNIPGESKEAAATIAKGAVAELRGELFDKKGKPVFGSAGSLEKLDALVRDDKSGLEAVGERVAKTFAELYADPKKGTKLRLATSQSVDEVKTTVKKQGESIEATATDLKGVKAATPFGEASGLIGFDLASRPKGVAARFMIMLKATTKSASRFVGFLMDLKSDGTAQVGVVASRFFFASGSDPDDLRVQAIKFEGNKAYLDQIYVKFANIIGLKVGEADIEDLSIGALKMKDGAVTGLSRKKLNREVRLGPGAGPSNVLTTDTIDNRSGRVPVVQVRGLVTGRSYNTSYDFAALVRAGTSPTVLSVWRGSTHVRNITGFSGGGVSGKVTFDEVFHDFDAPKGEFTYTLRLTTFPVFQDLRLAAGARLDSTWSRL